MTNPDNNTDKKKTTKLLTKSNYRTAFSGTIIMLLNVFSAAPENKGRKLLLVFLVPVTYLGITWLFKYIKAYSDEKMNPKAREWVHGILVILFLALIAFSFV